jgi:hypothetical protein
MTATLHTTLFAPARRMFIGKVVKRINGKDHVELFALSK